MKPLLGSCALSRMEKPTMANVSATPAILPTWPSTWRITSLVRATDAPSGNWMETKKPPWSSLGRKPDGVMVDTPKMQAPQITTATTASAERAISRRTMAV